MKNAEKKSILRLIDDSTEKIENVVMSVGLLFISIIVFINVITRYFFQMSLTWVEELSRYVVVWVTFFGICSCARYGEHVNVDLVPNLLKGSAKFIHQVLLYLLCMGISLYMTYISIQFTILQYQGGNTSIAITIPIWLIYLSTNIGFALMSYVYLRKLMAVISSRKTKKEVSC